MDLSNLSLPWLLKIDDVLPVAGDVTGDQLYRYLYRKGVTVRVGNAAFVDTVKLAEKEPGLHQKLQQSHVQRGLEEDG